ncbi:unnamed protein product, partial [Amoebophrya sp. A25]
GGVRRRKETLQSQVVRHRTRLWTSNTTRRRQNNGARSRRRRGATASDILHPREGEHRRQLRSPGRNDSRWQGEAR